MTDIGKNRDAAVFLDRDGTVSEEVGYMYDESLYKVFPWTGEAIRRVNLNGMKVILATNQSGIQRGYFTESTMHSVHDRLREEIAKAQAKLDSVYFCPHRPDTGCECRKPQPGMLFQAQRDLGLDLARSYMVGDRYLDVRTGKAAGAMAVLVLTGDGIKEYEQHKNAEIQPDFVAKDLAEAVDFILGEESHK